MRDRRLKTGLLAPASCHPPAHCCYGTRSSSPNVLGQVFFLVWHSQWWVRNAESNALSLLDLWRLRRICERRRSANARPQALEHLLLMELRPLDASQQCTLDNCGPREFVPKPEHRDQHRSDVMTAHEPAISSRKLP